MGYSPWGQRESDTTERLSRHPCQSNFSLHSLHLRMLGTSSVFKETKSGQKANIYRAFSLSQTLCLAMMAHYKCTNQGLALKLQASFSFLLQGMWNSGQIVEAAEPTANALAVKTSLAVWPNQRGAWAQPQVTVARTEGAPCQKRRKRVSGKEKWEAKGLLPFHHPPALKSFHVFCHPPTEATETSDQCWKGQRGFLPRNSLFKIIRSIITG